MLCKVRAVIPLKFIFLFLLFKRISYICTIIKAYDEKNSVFTGSGSVHYIVRRV